MVGNNNVIVVAHPDDETLWASSLPIKYQDRKWTIICCSVPRHDSIRAWKFFDACAVLRATPRLIPATESPPDKALTHLDILDLSKFDCIVTHNQWGEYGHLHHQNLHEFVTRRYMDKRILTFGYRKGGEGDIKVRLTDAETLTKMKALNCYDHTHPYQGKNIPKWEALLHRYRDVEGIEFFTETFDEYHS